jgi:hypothetical protein
MTGSAASILTVIASEAKQSMEQQRKLDCFVAALLAMTKTGSRPPSSFRGDAQHRTRNLDIPGLVLRTIPE